MTKTEFQKICDAAEGYIDLGMYQEAADTLEDLPSAAKISKEVIVLQMAILIKTGHILKASYLAESLSFADPENNELLLEVAHLRYDAGEPTEALKWLKSAESKCEGHATFHYLRAKCHAALGDLEACRLALAAAHSIDPSLRLKTLDEPAFEAIFGASPNL